MSDATPNAATTPDAAPAPVATDPTPPVEGAAAPPPETPAPPPTDAWEDRFAQLTAKSAELRKQEQSLKGSREAAEKHARIVELAKTNRLGALAELGINVDDLLVDVIGSDAAKPTDPIAEVRAEVERLKGERESEKTAQKKADQDTWFANYHRDISDQVRTGGDKYEALNALGRQDEVGKIIEGFFAQTGQVLPFEEAAELAENKALEFARAARGIKKLGSSEPAKAPTATAAQGIRTLTNGLTEPPKGAGQAKPLTREESLRRAVEMVESGQSPYLQELAEA